MSDTLNPLESALVASTPVHDELAHEHRAVAVRWLASTTDIHRRMKPATPSPHLVSYFLLVDRGARKVLLCDHRLAGRWLPTGGHVEPGEHPADTVRREASEELGIVAQGDDVVGWQPFFLTVTETVGPPASRHVDVTLWFALHGAETHTLTPDPREFAEIRWWGVGGAARRRPGPVRAAPAACARRARPGGLRGQHTRSRRSIRASENPTSRAAASQVHP